MNKKRMGEMIELSLSLRDFAMSELMLADRKKKKNTVNSISALRN